MTSYDSILTTLFPSIFAVTKNSFENWMAGKSLDVRRGAQIWKYIFRKSIMDKYYLRFPPHIIAGKDTMFLSSYILHCRSFLNIPDILYSYFIRPNGLYMSNLNTVDPHKSLQTKIDLLEERMRICGFYKMLTKSNIDEGRSLYAGSAILSCFQLAWLYSKKKLKYYSYFKIYSELPEVQLCIKSVPLVTSGDIKRRLPFWLLKNNMFKCLYLLFACAHIFKIRLNSI